MRILVVGGGIGGLTAAIALERQGFEVAVFEAASRWRSIGKGIWLPPNAIELLDSLGLAARIAAAGVALERIELADRHNRRIQGFELESLRSVSGQLTVSIRRSDLHAILLGQIPSRKLYLGRRVLGFEQDEAGVRIWTEDGTSFRGELLVAADGLHSTIRQALFPGRLPRTCGQVVARGLANLGLPSSLARTCRELWGGADRFGYSPVAASNVYWFAAFCAPPGQPGEEVFKASDLETRFSDFPFPVGELLAATPPEEVHWCLLEELPPLSRWWKGRVVLLGDAAHGMTPNLGQGGAQAIEDACVLARQLAHHDTRQRPSRSTSGDARAGCDGSGAPRGCSAGWLMLRTSSCIGCGIAFSAACPSPGTAAFCGACTPLPLGTDEHRVGKDGQLEEARKPGNGRCEKG